MDRPRGKETIVGFKNRRGKYEKYLLFGEGSLTLSTCTVELTMLNYTVELTMLNSEMEGRPSITQH